MDRWGTSAGCLAVILLVLVTSSSVAQPQGTPLPSPKILSQRDLINRFLDRHCLECHNGDDKVAGLALDDVSPEDVERHPEVWEKVVRKLASRQMPPRATVATRGARV